MKHIKLLVQVSCLFLLSSASLLFGAHDIVSRGDGFSYYPSPEDWRDVNMYQLFTDRFFDGNAGNNNVRGWYAGQDEWNRHRAMGGDWAGVRQKLDYLQGMGINAIWLSGVQMNAQGSDKGYTPYHAYHPTDFYKVEPMFGTFQELKDLIDDCHQRGIYVMIDVVINHMADLNGLGGGKDDYYHPHGGGDLFWWNGSERHAYPFDGLQYFHNHGRILDWNDGWQILNGHFVGTDDLRTSDPYVQGHLIDIFKHLIDATDCDGFRVDAIKHVERDFMMHWADEIRGHAAYRGKDKFILFGEDFNYGDYQVGLQCNEARGGRFNSALYFPMQMTIKNVFAYEQGTRQITERRNALHEYGGGAQNLVTFMDNHDVDRIALESGDQWDAKLRPALTFLYTGTPVPCLFYGTEQGFNQGGQRNQGIHDGDYQREVMWNYGYQPGNAHGDKFNTGSGLYQHIAKLNELRENHPSLRRGDFTTRWQEDSKGIYAYTRAYGNEESLVAFNTDWGQRSCDPQVGKPDGTVFVNMLNPSEALTVSGGKLNVSLGPKESKIFVAGAAPLSVQTSCTRDHLTITYDKTDGPLDIFQVIYIGIWRDDMQEHILGDGTTPVDGKYEYVYPLADVDNSVTFYFHNGQGIYDNNNGMNWVVDTRGCGVQGTISAVYGTSHFPTNPVDAGVDVWVDSYVSPKNASARANVIYSADGGVTWQAARMALDGSYTQEHDDKWNVNLGSFPGGTTVRYVVQAIGNNQEVWDNNGGDDYLMQIEGSSSKIEWYGNIRHWPTNGTINAQDNIWIDLDTRPVGAAHGGAVVYTVDGGTNWSTANLALNATLETHDAWHVNIGTFPASATIQYAIMVYDEDAIEYWDNNHGADYFAVVNPPVNSITWFGNVIGSTIPRPDVRMSASATQAGIGAENLPVGTRFTVMSSTNLSEWITVSSHTRSAETPDLVVDLPQGADRVYYRMRVDDVPAGTPRSSEDVVIRIETQPIGEAAAVYLAYNVMTDPEGDWRDVQMTYRGTSGSSDVWSVSIGSFPPETLIKYAIRMHDYAGREMWDNHNGEDYYVDIEL